jgi:hypothetical protein
MQDYFVYLEDDAAEERVTELLAVLKSYDLVAVRDSETAIKFRIKPMGLQSLTIQRDEFDSAIINFDDIIREFPDLPRVHQSN